MVSISASRWTRTAIAMFDIRACARAPSAMLMTSIPPALSMRAAASALDGSRPTGGFTSTEVTKRPAAILAASELRFPNGIGSAPPTGAPGEDDHDALMITSSASPRPPSAPTRRCA
jgi:hypothetical protein